MSSKTIKGFREIPKQDGSGKVKLERIPYFGAKDTSAKIRQRKSKRIKVKPPGFSALLTPIKK